MKTTFLPGLLAGLAIMLAVHCGQASTQPNLDDAGDSLETAPAATLASAELQPGPAQVAGENVNVRSKATIQSEVVTQLQDGDEVFVEEVILRPDAKGKDPARWAKIAYPAKAAAWVHSLYIDAATSTVKPRKLNVRSGPGENHTVVGGLRSGDTVVQLGASGDWLQIQPPEGSTAYIAAKLLRQEQPAEEVVVVETEAVETEVVEGQPEAAEGSELVVAEGVTTVEEVETNEASMELAQLSDVAPELQTIPEEPLPPRIVNREGIVRTYTQPHAPSHYRLVSAENGRLINYLYTTSTNLDLSRYIGLHIIATGEEELDERWDTPVLTLKRIVLVDFEE
jgi:uncharacterized protein YgiM (DUF1202 family)